MLPMRAINYQGIKSERKSVFTFCVEERNIERGRMRKGQDD